MAITDSYEWFIFYVVTSVISTLIQIGILLCHIVTTIRNKLRSDKRINCNLSEEDVMPRLYSISLMGTFISYAVQSLLACLPLLDSAFHPSRRPLFHCHQWRLAVCLSFGFGIVTLHTSLICRLYIAFSDSMYAYSRRFLYSLLISWLIIGIALTTIAGVLARCDMIEIRHGNDLYYENSITFPIWYGVFATLCFIAYECVSIYCFVTPLRKIVARISSASSIDNMQTLAIKASVTSVTALLTTIVTFVLIPFVGSSVIVRFDTTVNAICLACQCQSFKWLYRRMFCCVLVYIRRLDAKKQLEMTHSPSPTFVSSDIVSRS